MTDPQRSAGNELLVSRAAAREAFAQALCMFVGRGRKYSVKQLSNATGVPDRRIEDAKVSPEEPHYRPVDLEHVLSITRFLGPEFTSEWLRIADQGAFWLPDAGDLPPGELAAESAEDNAEIARRAADGKFCRDDKKVLRPVGIRMMARGAQIALGAAA